MEFSYRNTIQKRCLKANKSKFTPTPSHPHALTPSHPHTITPSHPHALSPSHPHAPVFHQDPFNSMPYIHCHIYTDSFTQSFILFQNNYILALHHTICTQNTLTIKSIIYHISVIYITISSARFMILIYLQMLYYFYYIFIYRSKNCAQTQSTQ